MFYSLIRPVIFLFFMAILGVCVSCKSAEKMPASSSHFAGQKPGVGALVDTSRIFSENFTGFELYDPASDSVLFAQNEGKYFTPASNTKLFTFYTCLNVLSDTLSGLKYVTRGDSLIFWGTGDPSFLHPDFGSSKIYNFLKNRSNLLFFSDTNFEDDQLGPGWSWGDYQYYYSAERSPLPMYGNVVRMTVQKIQQTKIKTDFSGLSVSPPLFRSKIQQIPGHPRKATPLLDRPFEGNSFKYSPHVDTVSYTLDKPYHYTPELITELLADTLGKSVHYISAKMPRSGVKMLFSVPKDTVFRYMLKHSDNFIAEQLLLNAASVLGKSLNTTEMIEYAKDHYLSGIPDEPQWVDGSGLSRYNLFTPRSMIWLLKKIYGKFADARDLYDLLPSGGDSGTISNWYGNRDGDEPYVFAKTGTLSNNHCLSGYVITRSGHTLIFSFMNNHYVTSSSVVKNEMEKVLWYIHEYY